MEKPRLTVLSTGTLVRTALVVLALAFAWFVRDILAVLFVSVLLAALIDPFADWFAKHRLPRGLAVILIYVILAAVFLAAVILLVPPVVDELGQLANNLPKTPFMDYLGRFRDITAQYGLEENLRSAIQSLQTGVTSTITGVFSTLRGALEAIAAMIVVLVIAFYMVVEEEAARRSFRHLAPEQYQPYLTSLFTKMQKKVGAWLRGQMLLGLVIGVTSYIGLTLLGVPYALLLAILAGLFELIPYIGPVLSVVPALIIAFGQSPLTAGFVGLFYIGIQQLENHILVPKIMQKATGLNPIVCIVALLVGVKIAGFAGALLSIPVATMVTVLIDELFHRNDSAA